VSIDYKNLPTGTEVEVTIKGKIEASPIYGNKPTWAVRVNDGSHFHHLCFNAVDSSSGLTVKLTEPEYEYGQAYMDSSGDILLRTVDGWLDVSGDRFSHDASYVKRPLTKLVKPAELQSPSETIAAICRAFDIPVSLLF
jgi:hypothetical protein